MLGRMEPDVRGGRARLRDPVVREAAVLSLVCAVIGVSYGVLAMSAGLSPLMAAATSVLIFSGGSQFAAVGVIAAGGTGLAAVASGVLVAGRFLGFGTAVAKLLPKHQGRRALASHLVIDESAALAIGRSVTDGEAAGRLAFWGAGGGVFVGWQIGTWLGIYAGQHLPDPGALGIDAAFPALFLALLAPLVRGRRELVAAVAGALIAVLLVPVAPAGVPIIASAGGVAIAMCVPRSPADPLGGQERTV